MTATATENTVRDFAALRDQMIEAMPERVHLVHVGQGDRLTDEQIAAVARGDWEALDSLIGEWLNEARYDGAKCHLDELLSDVIDSWLLDESLTEAEAEWIEGLRDEFPYSDEWDEVRYELEDRDESDPIGDLAWGATFIRVLIGEDSVFVEDEPDMIDVIDNLGMPDTPAMREALTELLPDLGTDYATPFIFASVDVGDLYRLMGGPEDGEVVIRGGSLLLENIYAGSGWNVELPSDHRITVKRSAIRTDADQIGYAWDDVCGFVGGAYPAELEAVGK